MRSQYRIDSDPTRRAGNPEVGLDGILIWAIIGTAVLRSIASSVLSLLVVAAFLWGGCVSCQQFFMFPGKRQQCCNKSGQCERPGKNSPKPEKQDCNRLPLDRGGNVHDVPPPALLPATIATDIVQLPALALPSQQT